MAKTFSIYRSSAGSGKTRTLAKEYLKLALKYRADYFKHILAVTFTNKASQEMKDRILAYLDAFANGKPNELAAELQRELNLDEQTFRQYSQAVQRSILHQYSQFSISTIDAFFQRVIRAFTREAGLTGDYKLEVEHDEVLEQVIDNLIDELGNNRDLTEWVVEFAKENLENERAWDVRYSLIEFAKEIFREEFKAIENDVHQATAVPGYFKGLKEMLWQQKNFFIGKVSRAADEALTIIQQNGWTHDDFSYGKNSGLFTFFNVFSFEKNLSRIKPPGERIRNYFTHADNWPNKKSTKASAIHRVAAERLVPLLHEILSAYETYFVKALSAEVALKNLYVFGLITDIARKLKDYKSENNIMLLADAPKFLNGVIQDSDTPFVYEKVGSFYRNYLIDEFQDTSGMQWKNFQPLIVNSLDQGYPSLVVGDVKQAIYRWRGGDLSLLQQQLGSLIGNDRIDVHELDKNFRSAQQLVNFNNALFQSAAAIVAGETGALLSSQTYLNVMQRNVKTEDGFVRIHFIRENDIPGKQLSGSEDDTDDDQSSGNWQDVSLDTLPKMLEELQSLGVELKDIAILVRKNEEGQRIANHLLQYKNSGQGKANCKYDVVSNESLRIDGAAGVNLLLGAMRYLLNPEDSIARAQLGYEFSRLHEPDRSTANVFTVANQTIFENNLPDAFKYQKTTLKKLPLIELTETLIEIFRLGKQEGELVYLQAFQDVVLDFYNRERNDLGAFLEWWEGYRYKKSVQLPGDVDAVQILTIHKAKGLQFKYVIIPFCSWAMDHEIFKAPNLWVRSDQAPFSDAGYLPVKYQSILKQTCFTEPYEQERVRCYLDNLNLLYVALTRAEHGLMVIAPHREVRGAKATVAGLLLGSIQMSEALKDKWKEPESIWQSGTMRRPANEPVSTAKTVQLTEYFSSTWREKLVIRKSGSEFFKNITDQRLKINYGMHMHAVLSRIKYAEEIDHVLDQLVIEGLIPAQDKKVLEAQLTELMKLTKVASWFTHDWEVQTEIPILLPEGSLNRLDRLLLKNVPGKGKKAVVIDFKTGERKKQDSQQVIQYMEILRQMNFIEVEGCILYLGDKAVLEVKEGGKEKIVKKKVDKDQLSIGFN